MGIIAVRYSDRPAMWDEMAEVSEEVWPEYNRHGDVLNRYWGRLYDEFAEFQFALFDEDSGEVVAEGHTAPCPWDGTPEGLGEGIDTMLVAAFDAREREERPGALCALAAEIRPGYQGRGLAARMLVEMAGLARSHGLASLVAPVRPSLKEHYPLTPIERYFIWTREDDLPFDPWLRTHVRCGGRILRPAPHSMLITGTVAEWEAWTALAFPESGEFTFPRGLATLTIDRPADLGTYWEPNVWVAHETRT